MMSIFINYWTNFVAHLQAVNEVSGHVDVASMMETWTNQIGYPVIAINTANGEISQKHFLYNDSSESRYVINVSAYIIFTLEL